MIVLALVSVCALFPWFKERADQVKKIKTLATLFRHCSENTFRELTIGARLFFVLWNHRTLAEEIF